MIETAFQLDAQHALNRYEQASPSFSETREYKFIKEIMQHVEGGDEESYTAAVNSFDRISRLDEWHTHILLKIKKGIAKDDEDDLR